MVDLDEKTGRRLWITGVADPTRGLHIVCSFKGDTRPASLVEMHFERGSQSLPLGTVGLGEFALPFPQIEEGVQLAQARYDEISPLLEAQFAPSWRALEGYKLMLWNDANPALAFDGLQQLELQRKDREPEGGSTGAPAAAGASGDAALPNALEARAQRLLESKP